MSNVPSHRLSRVNGRALTRNFSVLFNLTFYGISKKREIFLDLDALQMCNENEISSLACSLLQEDTHWDPLRWSLCIPNKTNLNLKRLNRVFVKPWIACGRRYRQLDDMNPDKWNCVGTENIFIGDCGESWNIVKLRSWSCKCLWL